ncbi:hypothetical protein TDB9533_00689 [Thalassocella blandensis]|nr:hypothetical protein TDB9533_00689 [Thalassocella blandensis]
MKILLYATLSLIGLTSGVISTTAAADFRCSTRLVQVGDSMDEVLDKCGDPNRVFNHAVNYRRASYGGYPYREEYTAQTYVDVWVYKLSSGQFSRSVVFEQGEVIDIKKGSRVSY